MELRKVLNTKTGRMNMGGYFEEKTTELYTFDFILFRVRYKSDSVDEVFRTYEEAYNRFKIISKSIEE